ncbi:MAG TPA: arginase family protein [Actinophytocola sp.]|uniref:arginase family protein n=1 Tax=Actinophytocola sp. TaxID=1872138 RepID=UPI002DDD13CB|nr:arginase family protein [Actinophytocola sp.]HEV2779377.1 arginase family protein [Actinophytocola sp.]
MTTRILVPYHLDEHLPTLDVPLHPDRTVTAPLPEGDAWSRLAALQGAVAAAVRESPHPVVISGDCVTALGTVAGLQRSGLDPAIVWLDAHGDVQTLETTTSGYLGGLPLRILAGYRPDLIANALGLRPVPEHRIVLVDARDLDPPEADYLGTSAIRHVPLADAPRTLPPGPLYLHVDLDIVDPLELPGLRYPAPAGPGITEVTDTIRQILATAQVCGIGLACTWHPTHTPATRLRTPIATALTRWNG